MDGFNNKYPYTDFHELNLDWFLSRFHSLLQEWTDLAADNAEFKQTMTERFNTLDQTVAEFIRFVNNFFDNLDVQQEINHKLDVMAADGTLDALLLPYFNAYKAQINGIMNNQNSRISVLESRMDTFTHLTEGSTSGDAELQDIRVAENGDVYPSAGDAVRGQIEGIENSILRENSVIDVSKAAIWEQGSIASNTGSNSTSTTRMRTKGYIPQYIEKITATSGFFSLFAYNNDVYVGIWNGTTFTTTSTSLYDVNLSEIRSDYPSYKYRIVWGMAAHTTDPATDYQYMKMTYVDEITEKMLEFESGISKNAEDIELINDAILSEEVTIIDYSSADTWESGSISIVSGQDAESDTRMRTGFIPEETTIIETTQGYVQMARYNSEGVYAGFLSDNGWVTSNAGFYNNIDLKEIKEDNPGYKFRLVWLLANHTAVPATDYNKIKITHPESEAEEVVVEYKDRIKNLENITGAGVEPTGIIGMFEKWAVIGTSYDCGVMYLPDGTAAGNPYMGWEHQLARRYGNTQERLAAGGMRCNLWLNVPDERTPVIPPVFRNYNLSRLIEIGSTLNLVMITLGCNDAAHASDTGISIGDITDIVTELPETILEEQTFAYYYSCVICAVKQYAPQAKIIICHSFLKTSMIDTSYNNLPAEKSLKLAEAVARASYLASRQGVDIMDQLEYEVFPLELTEPVDKIAGAEGHTIDFEKNAEAINEFLFAE